MSLFWNDKNTSTMYFFTYLALSAPKKAIQLYELIYLRSTE